MLSPGEQIGLFDAPMPRHNGTDTSREAALSLHPISGALRQRVLEVITRSAGMTCDEVEDRTGLSHQTASARVNELSRLGLLIDTGERRKTRSGRNAKVWRAG